MTAADGKTCNTRFYDLDAIIPVGLPGFSSAWQDIHLVEVLSEHSLMQKMFTGERRVTVERGYD